MSKEKMKEKAEALLEEAGQLGLWQWIVFFALSLEAFLAACHHLGYLFLGAIPMHHCKIPDLPAGWDIEQAREIFLPRMTRDDKEIWSECRIYNRNYTLLSGMSFEEARNYTLESGDTQTEECHEWFYDPSVYVSTTVTEWNLVCDRRALLATIQGSYMGGVLIGAMLFGMMSDKWGRRPSTLVAVVIQVAASIGTAFAPNYIVFVCLRMLIAMCITGAYVGGFVLMSELVGSKRRSIISMLYQVPFGLGYMALPGVAYLLREWRHLQLAISVPTVLLLFYFWLIPESPRWLLTNGRLDEAEAVIRKGCKINKRPLPDHEELMETLEVFRKTDADGTDAAVAEEKKPWWRHVLEALGTIVTLFRTPEMCRRILIAYFAWFVVTLTYYGLSLASTNMPGDPFLVTFIMGAMELPAYFFTSPIIQRFGRRLVTCVTLFIAGIACLLIMAVPQDLSWLSITLAMLGKLSISSTFAIVYLLVAELMPTVVRNIALGGASVVSRAGSISAPYIVDLLGAVHFAIPPTIFGGSALAAGLVCMLLPETTGVKMPETVEDVENFRKEQKLKKKNKDAEANGAKNGVI